jgi:hypothetical protein
MNVDEARRIVSRLLDDTEQSTLVSEAFRKIKSSGIFELNHELKKIWSRSFEHPDKYRLICLSQYRELVDFFKGEESSICVDLGCHLMSYDKIVAEEFGVLVSSVSLRLILSIKPLALPQDLASPSNLAFLLYDWAYNHSWESRVLILAPGIERLRKTGPSGEALARVFTANSVEGVCCPTILRLKELALAVLLGSSLVELHGLIGIMDADGLITFGSTDGCGPEMVYSAKSDSWPDY